MRSRPRANRLLRGTPSRRRRPGLPLPSARTSSHRRSSIMPEWRTGKRRLTERPKRRDRRRDRAGRQAAAGCQIREPCRHARRRRRLSRPRQILAGCPAPLSVASSSATTLATVTIQLLHSAPACGVLASRCVRWQEGCRDGAPPNGGDENDYPGRALQFPWTDRVTRGCSQALKCQPLLRGRPSTRSMVTQMLWTSLRPSW